MAEIKQDWNSSVVVIPQHVPHERDQMLQNFIFLFKEKNPVETIIDVLITEKIKQDWNSRVVVIPQHVLHERDQMLHQCIQHERSVQVPKLNKERRCYSR